MIYPSIRDAYIFKKNIGIAKLGPSKASSK